MRYREGDVSCSTDEQWVCLLMSVVHNHDHGDNSWQVSLLFSWTEYLGVFRDGSNVYGGRNKRTHTPTEMTHEVEQTPLDRGRKYTRENILFLKEHFSVPQIQNCVFWQDLPDYFFSGIFLYLTKSNQQTQNKTSATACKTKKKPLLSIKPANFKSKVLRKMTLFKPCKEKVPAQTGLLLCWVSECRVWH